jgi:hypothetical protein
MNVPKSSRRRAFLLPAAVIVLATGSFYPVQGREPAGANLHVWTLSSWARTLRSDPPGAGREVTLYAARGEWESFQVAVRAPRRTRLESLSWSSLEREGGATLPKDCLRAYRAHQLHITRGTYRNESFREGWYPDALIPVAPGATQANTGTENPRYRALPFELPAGETHTFWADVHVPGAAEPGVYQGEVRLEWAAPPGGPTATTTIPLVVRVWSFGLPVAPALKTEFGSSAPRIIQWLDAEEKKGRAHESAGSDALYAACARLTTEHRLNSRAPPELMPRPGPDGRFELTEEQTAGWKTFLSTYSVSALPVPPPHRYFKDPEADRSAMNAYLASWDRALEAIGQPDLLCYTYLIDEPNDPEAYEFTRTWGRLIRESGSRVRVLVTEQTKAQKDEWGTLHGSVDIWVPLFSLFDPESAARRREQGEQIWTYTALCQRKPTPWWHTDFPLLHYRVPAWMAWLHHMEGLLYWGGMAYWRGVEDPWTEPGTYTQGGKPQEGREARVFNGEGTLLYPGWAAGVDGPLPSMRLKALRDGIEDYEYLKRLEELGRRPVAEALIRSVVGGWYEWSRDAERYVHVRRKLGCLIQDVLKTQEPAKDR